MDVRDHHSLDELQRLAMAVALKRTWLRYQAVILAYLAQFRENLGDFRVPNLQNPRFFRSGNRPQGL